MNNSPNEGISIEIIFMCKNLRTERDRNVIFRPIKINSGCGIRHTIKHSLTKSTFVSAFRKTAKKSKINKNFVSWALLTEIHCYKKIVKKRKCTGSNVAVYSPFFHKSSVLVFPCFLDGNFLLFQTGKFCF